MIEDEKKWIEWGRQYTDKSINMKHYLLIFFIILFSCCKTSNKKEINMSDKEIALTIAEKNGKKFMELQQ